MAYIKQQKNGGYFIVAVNVWERFAKQELGIKDKETSDLPTKEDAESLVERIEKKAAEIKARPR